MNKKIVILHPAFWKQAMGGAEIQIKYLVDYLIDKNVQVHYIFEDKNIKIDNPIPRNLTLHPLSRIKISKRFGNRWYLYKKRIDILLKKIEPDGIYTRFFSSWSGFASEYAKQNNIPHVWALASDNDLKVLTKPINYFKPLDVIENNYVKKAFIWATHIIVQNYWQANQLYQKHNRQGIHFKQAAPTNYLGLPKKENGTLRVIWIANMKPLKRPDLFIKIASQFKEIGGVNFKMVGRLDSNYATQIKEEENCNPAFKYLGELKNDDVNSILTETDILINTSDYEGFSNTFVQAWMRKNIVISMNSNPDEILTKFNVGFLCSTVEEVEAKLSLLKTNPNILKEMQNKAFNYANKEHNLDINLNAIYSLLKLS